MHVQWADINMKLKLKGTKPEKRWVVSIYCGKVREAETAGQLNVSHLRVVLNYHIKCSV